VNRRDLLLTVVPLGLSRFGMPSHRSNPSAPRAASAAVVFDAYGTLFDVHSVVTLANELFPGQGDALSQRWRAKQLEYSGTLSLMQRYEDFWDVTGHALTFACHALKLPCTASEHQRLMDSYLRLSTFADAPAGLAQLAGTTLAILSNGSPRMLGAAVSSAGLAGVFKRVISVDAIRVYKPDPRVYRLAADTLDVPPASVLFVSSNAWDVGGAKAFGFRTCWVNRDGAPPEELGLNADIAIRSLRELPQAV
jgi:2-haloacid dehalogenase